MNAIHSISAFKATVMALAVGAAFVGATMPLISNAQGFEKPTNEANLASTGGDTTVAEVIVIVTQWLAGLLAALAILAIVIAGILYITSAGNSDRIELAKSILIYAIIGLIVALLAFVIVNTVATALNAG